MRAERLSLIPPSTGWPEGWSGFDARWEDEAGDDVSEVTAAAFDSELLSEVADGHPLYGRQALAIAKRHATDDVLFAFPGSAEVAVVHLTWVRHVERPPWPLTTPYASVDAFLAAVREDFGD